MCDPRRGASLTRTTITLRRRQWCRRKRHGTQNRKDKAGPCSAYACSSSSKHAAVKNQSINKQTVNTVCSLFRDGRLLKPTHSGYSVGSSDGKHAAAGYPRNGRGNDSCKGAVSGSAVREGLGTLPDDAVDAEPIHPSNDQNVRASAMAANADRIGERAESHHGLRRAHAGVQSPSGGSCRSNPPTSATTRGRSFSTLGDLCTPDPRRPDPSVEDSNDPDVWAPPSPEKAPNRFRGGGAARAAPSWANDNNSNNNNPRNNRVARKSTGGSAGARGAVPSGRRTPGDDQRRQAPRRGGSKPPTSASPARQSKDGGLKAARKDNERARERGGGGSEKPKYSEKAKEEGWVDLELIEMIERDIVDSAAAISFEQIAGLEHTKQLLQEAVMLPQIAPHLFKDGLLKPCNGVLMFGPPGTGKTLLAKAVANVCKSTFFNVSASTLASKYRGESERMVRILFDMARYYSPSIIFMDEIDAIAGARGGAQEHESSRRVKTELLVQINGVSSGDPADPGNRVMVLAATNLPWELDEAMRRRLSKRVYIPLPEPPGRHQLFKLNLEKVDVATDVDFDKLVASTEGYSGDDICGLCDTAKMMPVKRLYTPEVLKELHRKQQEGASDEELQAHEKNALEITWNDFQTALENVSKSVGQDQLERFVKWEEEFGSK